MSEKPVSYVRAAERLEAIMAEIESGTVDIDKLSALLKEADGLIKFCRDKLYKVDNEVNTILQRMSDDLSAER